jgi:septum formation protein
MMKPETGQFWLASRSARRVKLLAEAGIDVVVTPCEVDDSALMRGAGTVEEWVMGLAYLKARSAADALREQDRTAGLVIGADTVCVHNGDVLGQPVDEQDARRMIEQMRSDVHDVITGLCLIDLSTGERTITFDRAEVRVGDITEEQIASHLSVGAWVGKAGAYNLDEQLAAGWDVECTGDPTTVMGLPMKRLETLLAFIGACD